MDENISDGRESFEPNIYSGNAIAVTHGANHEIIILDQNTFSLIKSFEGYPEPKFLEMHQGQLSFDGKKLIIDNGNEFRFGFYDLEKDDSTITDIAIPELYGYKVGQISWSLDNENILAIDFNNTLISYNISSQISTSLFNGAKYISIVPGSPNLVAVLTTNNGNSDIQFLDIDSQNIVETYNDIPFSSPFRILLDKDKIYFDGELAIYSLSQKMTQKIQIDELDLSKHMYGEADITMDGSRFVLSDFANTPKLFMIYLPSISAK